MKRVTGIGGVFIRARDPAALRAWYATHLGIEIEPWGGAAFRWVDEHGAPVGGMTLWSASDGSTFPQGEMPFMVNYRVDDLLGLLAALREEGCPVEDRIKESEFGKFGWVMDPEGNRVELREPPEGR
ncbi:MAG: glyoxalase/bleomycin resistance/dioxygenase family protein [Planctomycetota bacterium]